MRPSELLASRDSTVLIIALNNLLLIYIHIFSFAPLADLVHCTNEPNVSIPHLANLLIERSQNANWVVVYKSLITTHHLMAYGNEVCIPPRTK